MSKTETWKKIHVTPCCKTRYWHAVITRETQGQNVVRCERCDKVFDGELLEEVVRGLNPVTFFCDRCGISAKILERQAPEEKEEVGG